MSYNSLAQSADSSGRYTRYGIFVGVNYNIHQANFQKLPGVPNCCPKFTDGLGWGSAAGLTWELPLPYSLYFGLKLKFNNISGTLTSDENTFVRIDTIAYPGVFQHVLNSNIYVVGFEPFISYNIIGGFEVFAGGNVGYFLVKQFDQYEQIKQPADQGVFQDTRTRKRDERSGEIPDISTVYGGFSAGMNYHLPLNADKSLLLVPEVSYTRGTNKIVTTLDWSIHYLQFGVGLKYAPIPKIVIPEKPVIREEHRYESKIDTMFALSPEANIRSFALGISKTEKKIENLKDLTIIYEKTTRIDTIFKLPALTADISVSPSDIHLQAQFVTQAFPILPIVFFDIDKAVLNDYISKVNNKDNFSIENLEINQVGYHKNLLNIIGKRMTDSPNSLISLTGSSDSTLEQGNCGIAQKRAQEVKNYLTSVWKINENRVQISLKEKSEKQKAQSEKRKTSQQLNPSSKGDEKSADGYDCTPENPTNTKNDSGYIENCRVEIFSGNPEILEPIIKKKFLETINKDSIDLEIKPLVSIPSAVAHWKVVTTIRNMEIFSKSSNGAPIPVNYKFEIDNPGQIHVKYEITSADSQKTFVEKLITIKSDTSENEKERLSLILFNFASDKIPDFSKKGLESFINSMEEIDHISIIGYSDILGTNDFNINLSVNRAANTAKYIKEFQRNVIFDEVKGVGSTIFPPGIKSYSTPAERFLSRTVYIEIMKKWR